MRLIRCFSFGKVSNSRATAEELEQVPQMNRKAAESVYLFFHKPEKIQEDNAQAGAGNENT